MRDSVARFSGIWRLQIVPDRAFSSLPPKHTDRQVRSIKRARRKPASRLTTLGFKPGFKPPDVKNDSNHSSKKLATRTYYSPPLIIISKHHPSANATLSALATALTLAKTFSRSFSSSRGP